MTDSIKKGFQDLLSGNVVACTLPEMESALAEAIESKDRESELECRLLRARHHLRFGQVEKAEADYRLATSLGTSLGLQDRYEDILEWSFGYIEISRGNAVDALSHLTRGLNIARSIGRRVSEYGCLLSLASVYMANGSYAKAISYTREVVRITKDTTLQIGYVSGLLSLSQLYRLRNDFEAALQVSDEVIEAAIRLGEPELLSRVYNNRAASLVEVGEYQEAAAMLALAEPLLANFPESTVLAGLELLSAKIAIGQRNHAEAVRHYDLALGILRRVGEQRMLANGLGLYGLYLCDKEQFDKAQELLDESLAVATAHGDTQGIASACEHLARVYAGRNDYKQAYEFAAQQHAAEKQLAADEADGQLRLLRIENEVERRELEMEKYRLKAKLLEQDLANSTLTLLAQTELLSDFRDSLREIVRRIPPTEPAIRELKEKLKELPCKSVDWPKFEAQFASVHPEFKSQLVVKYPLLSKAELRMCILMRMGLKTEEIARLTCLSTRSVEDHRYQIRKKLGLAKGENVPDALAKV